MSTGLLFRRRVTGAALLLSGAALGALTTVAGGLWAQDPMAALETRVAALEEAVSRLGSDDAPPKAGGLVVRAPFTVIGDGDKPVLSLSGTITDSELTMGDDSGGGAGLTLKIEGNKSSISVGTGNTEVKLEVDPENAFLQAESAKGDSVLGASEFGWGLFLNDPGGQPAVDIAQPEGKGMALRVYQDGNSVAAVGAIPGEGGAVRVFASNASGAAAAMNAQADGSGRVFVTDGSKPAVTLDGQEKSVLAEGDAGKATLGGRNAGWGLFLDGPGGAPLAEIAQPAGKGMSLRVYDEGKQVAAIGAIPGEGGAARVFAPSGEGAAVAINAHADGSGAILVTDGNEPAFTLDGQDRVLTAEGEAGRIQLGKASTGWGLFLQDKADQPMADLSDLDGRAMALRIYQSGEQLASIGAPTGFGGSVRLFSPGAEGAAVALNALQGGGGEVLVNDDAVKEAIKLDGAARSVLVTSEAGTARLGSGGEGGASGWGLFLGKSGGEPSADLSQPAGRGMALRIYDAGKPVAAMGTATGEGGAVRVYTTGGNPAAVLNATADGSGLVQVYGSGKPTAALVGARSVVEVYNSGGLGVASLSLASNGQGGNVTLRDGGGAGVFSAGAATGGLGQACVNRVRGDGQGETACLGVGLPGMGMGK